jgi:DNA mismatch repair protein MutL
MSVAVLPEDVVAQIAAGEVVERPASVVKELIENALDAGARRIRVDCREGGRALIRVGDDGGGMTPEDLRLAIRPHATSKLRRAEDLAAIATLGFRGEALPSIAAVSRLTIVSRPPDAAAGRQIVVEANRLVSDAPRAAAPGTVVAVEDLFAATPARLKFLKTVATESAVISRAVAAYALAYPAVAVELRHNDDLVFATDGRGDPLTALAAVHGAATAKSMIPIAAELPPDEHGGAVRLAGHVSLPPLSRSHRQEILLFVNRRWVQSRSLTFALEEAYQGLLMVGRHPLAAVHIAVPPHEVDVNTHPTKAEVRLVHERRIFRALRDAVGAALAAIIAGVPEFGAEPPLTASGQRRLALASLQPAAPRIDPLPAVEPAWRPAPSPERDSGPPLERLPILRVVGQVGNAYIIAEGPTGLYLIDQHAAHERIVYEELRGQLAKAAVESQLLLDPIAIEPSPVGIEFLETRADDLAAAGFAIEPFGPGVYAVRAVPGILRRRDVGATVLAIVEELAAGGEGDWLERLAVTTACHSSIRAGQALSPEEMRQLIAQLERCAQPRHCTHGRPTMLHLSQHELEREFGRRA